MTATQDVQLAGSAITSVTLSAWLRHVNLTPVIAMNQKLLTCKNFMMRLQHGPIWKNVPLDVPGT